MKDRVVKPNIGAEVTSVPKQTRAAAKAERRQQLIDATITSIVKFGLSGTTIARVTEIAGTSIGLANFHFASKERLFEATLHFLADEQRDQWQRRNLDPSLTNVERLLTIADSRFQTLICDRRKLAVWFAFHGDAGARAMYRKIVGDVDDERLDATVAILTALIAEGGYSDLDPLETALSIESLYDGLWLNMLLYPTDFKRIGCRKNAFRVLASLFPQHFVGVSDSNSSLACASFQQGQTP
jgi:TetR/AcrR family transcriptional regulator, transcriptional repressor of bet genes